MIKGSLFTPNPALCSVTVYQTNPVEVKGLIWPYFHKVRDSMFTEKDLVKIQVFGMIYEVISSTSLFQLGNLSSSDSLRNDHTGVCPLFVGMSWIVRSRGITNNLTTLAKFEGLEKVPVMYRLTSRCRLASLLFATVWEALSHQNIAPSDDESPTQHIANDPNSA